MLKKKVLLVEDHPVTRMGLRTLIEAAPDLAVVAECDNYDDALRRVRELSPDVVVVDIGLRDTDGIHLTHNIGLNWPTIPVVVVSMHEERVYGLRALKAGAKGYVMKQEAGDKVVDAIRAVLRGEISIGAGTRLAIAATGARGRGTPLLSIDLLSPRQLEVFGLIGEGYSTREIAHRLELSIKTIETFRDQLKQKLELPDGTTLLRRAIEWRHSVASRSRPLEATTSQWVRRG
jgi:DNA-binding NarL/FixJ family response regulator